MQGYNVESHTYVISLSKLTERPRETRFTLFMLGAVGCYL